MRKKWPLFLLAVGLVAVVVVLMTVLEGPEPTPTPTTVSATELIEDLLDYSETIQVDPESIWPEFEEMVSRKEKECKQNRHDAACWIILGQTYVPSSKYREALDAYTIAYEINPRIADPYYARGNLYYDLAMLDLIRKRRFVLDADNLVFTVEPDKDSAVLFAEVIDEFARGEQYPIIQDSDSSTEVLLTTLYIVEHREEQINNFFAGSTTVEFHRVELGW